MQLIILLNSSHLCSIERYAIHSGPSPLLNLTIIRRECSSPSSQLSLPPVHLTWCFLDNLDSITLSECQIAISLSIKVVQCSDELALLARELLWWWRWWLFLSNHDWRA